MATARPFEKQVCKCERCGHEWLSENPVTCAKCRSPYWNMLRVKENTTASTMYFTDVKPMKIKAEIPKINIVSEKPEPKVTILDEKQQVKAALQCAIVEKFNCEYKRSGIPATALCKTCFTAPFWTEDKVVIENLLSVFATSQGQEPDKSEPVLEDDDIEEDTDIEIPVMKSADSVVNDDLQTMKNKCYLCTKKVKNDKGYYDCNFFGAPVPKYGDQCRFCWELVEIFGNRALGYKK